MFSAAHGDADRPCKVHPPRKKGGDINSDLCFPLSYRHRSVAKLRGARPQPHGDSGRIFRAAGNHTLSTCMSHIFPGAFGTFMFRMLPDVPGRCADAESHISLWQPVTQHLFFCEREFQKLPEHSLTESLLLTESHSWSAYHSYIFILHLIYNLFFYLIAHLVDLIVYSRIF